MLLIPIRFENSDSYRGGKPKNPIAMNYREELSGYFPSEYIFLSCFNMGGTIYFYAMHEQVLVPKYIKIMAFLCACFNFVRKTTVVLVLIL